MVQEKTASPRRQVIWKCVRIGLLAALVLAVLSVLFLLYVLLFKIPDEYVSEPAAPAHGALVQQRAQAFRWEDDGSPQWEFRILDGDDKMLYFQRVTTNRVVVPEHVLEAEKHFTWEVASLDKYGKLDEMVMSRRFRTAAEVIAKTLWRPVHVFPDRLTVRAEEMVYGFRLEISHSGPWRVTLPQELVFADGEKSYDGWSARLLYLKWDYSRAAGPPAKWGPVKVWVAGQPIEIPLVSDREGPSHFIRDVSPGFDPYRDTPSFANFSRSLFSRLTQGTCVGIVLAVKLFHESVDFSDRAGMSAEQLAPADLIESMVGGRRLVVSSSPDFKELSRKRADLVMSLMSELHFENLSPGNIKASLRAILLDDWAARTEKELWRQLSRGKLGLVAGFRLRRKVVKTLEDLVSFTLLDSGHAMLVYRGWQFKDATVFAVYDPNYEYFPERPLVTVLVFRRGGKPAYYSLGELVPAMVRFLPLKDSRLFNVLGVAVHGVKERLRTVGESARDLVRMLRKD